MQQESYRGFKELNCWKEARSLRRQISILTKTFPKEEKFELISQMKRASRSVTANIAEGYGRYTYNDTRHFFINARGSVAEILDHLSVAIDEEYINEAVSEGFEKQCETVFKLLNGYIAYLDRENKLLKQPNSQS